MKTLKDMSQKTLNIIFWTNMAVFLTMAFVFEVVLD